MSMEYKEETAGQGRPAREASATSKGFKQRSDSSIRPLKEKSRATVGAPGHLNASMLARGCRQEWREKHEPEEGTRPEP